MIETHFHNFEFVCQKCINNSEIAIKSYNLFKVDKKNKNGGAA